MRVNREQLLDTLRLLRATVETRGLNPVFQNVVLRDGVGCSFDGECGTILACPKDISMMVNAEQLSTCLSKLPGEEIELLCDNLLLVLASGRSKTTVGASDPDLFPRIYPSNFTPFCGATNFSDAIETCLRLVDTSETLSQIGIRGAGVYSTDGRRITRVLLDAASDGRAVAISCRAAKAFLTFGKPIKVLANDSQLIGNFPKIVFTALFQHSRCPFDAIDRLAGTPPNVNNCKLLPNDIPMALERAMAFNSRTGAVVLESTGKDLILTSGNDRGKSEDAFDWPFHPFRVGINPRHLLQAIPFSLMVDWSSLLSPSPKFIRFVKPGADHFVGLMEL